MTRSHKPTERFVAGSGFRTISRVTRSVAFVAALALTVMGAPQAFATSGGASQVFAWGSNGQGSLGNGTNLQSNVPVATLMTGALAGETIAQASAGSDTACAVTVSGSLYCWGMGLNGELGNGANQSSTAPVAVSTSGVLAGKFMTQVEVYSNFSCALSSEGRVYCWGVNGFDQFGTGTSSGNSNVPVAVSTTAPSALAGRTVTALSRGGFATVCAVLDNGAAACWGAGFFGGMGNGTNDVANATPVAVTMSGAMFGNSFAAITGGTFSMHAIATDGTLVSWGRDNSGQLGDGGTDTDSNIPVLVNTAGALSGLTAATIDSGGERSCALTTAARVYCWGANGNGTFGIGTTGTTSSVPVAALTSGALSGASIAQVSVGSEEVCALTTAGALGCTGEGSSGQLGFGATTSYVSSAVLVSTAGVLSGKSILGISVGDVFVLAWGAGADAYDPQAPADVMQQVGLPGSGSCTDVNRPDLNWSGVPSGGWGQSWAEWANERAGGEICVRTLYYRSGSGTWGIRA